jgi:hypothetical protein
VAGRIPEIIISLHAGEEDLHATALTLIEADARFTLHLDIGGEVPKSDWLSTLESAPGCGNCIRLLD